MTAPNTELNQNKIDTRSMESEEMTIDRLIGVELFAVSHSFLIQSTTDDSS